MVSGAHLVHLAELGLVPRAAASACAGALLEALDRRSEILSGDYEDVHEALEAWVARRVGEEAAGWMGLGKSRNDQVSAAIRIALRSRLLRALREAAGLRGALISLAGENADSPMPAFTHLRHAQPTTLGHYALSVEASVAHHWRAMARSLGEVNRSPMGAAAACGPTLPLDRERVARLLGFDGIEENTLYATGSRDFLLTAASAAAWLLVALSRVAEDLIIWSSPEFGYLRVPREHAAASSVMPQKANPVTLEVVRARAGEAVGRLAAAAAAVKGVPSGYNLDLQEATLHALWIVGEAASAAAAVADLLSGAEWDLEAMEAAAAGPGGEALAQDLAEELASRGVPFRRAHQEVAREIAARRDVLAVARALGLPAPDVRSALARRTVAGGPNPEEVRRAAEAAASRLEGDLGWLSSVERAVAAAEGRLVDELRRLSGSDSRRGRGPDLGGPGPRGTADPGGG